MTDYYNYLLLLTIYCLLFNKPGLNTFRDWIEFSTSKLFNLIPHQSSFFIKRGVSVCSLLHLIFLDINFYSLFSAAGYGRGTREKKQEHLRKGCLCIQQTKRASMRNKHGTWNMIKTRDVTIFCLLHKKKPFFFFTQNNTFTNSSFLISLIAGQELFRSGGECAHKIRGLLKLGNGERRILPSRPLVWLPRSDSKFCTTSCWPKCPSAIMLIFNTRHVEKTQNWMCWYLRPGAAVIIYISLYVTRNQMHLDCGIYGARLPQRIDTPDDFKLCLAILYIWRLVCGIVHLHPFTQPGTSSSAWPMTSATLGHPAATGLPFFAAPMMANRPSECATYP